jgi:hypothetical protein
MTFLHFGDDAVNGAIADLRQAAERFGNVSQKPVASVRLQRPRGVHHRAQLFVGQLKRRRHRSSSLVMVPASIPTTSESRAARPC